VINFLQGKPQILKNKLLVICNGVGYGVYVGSRVLSQVENLPEVSLYIFTHVKEDKLDLYGFLSEQDLLMFELIVSVSGVGPKIAINIVDQGVNKIVDAVQNAKTTFFSAIPRIGKKLAQKIIIELRSKLGSIKELNLAPLSAKDRDIYDALLALGFEEHSIAISLDKLNNKNLSTEETIKEVIKLISHKK